MSNNSRIARPLSVTSILQATSIPPTSNRRRVSSISDHEKKKSNKRPTSRLSKSHSMHRLADSYLSDNEEDTYQQQMHRRALLSRATTTPMPKPSSLIKRFSSEHNNGVLVASPKSSKTNAVKSASSTTSTTIVATSTMRRSSSLMNPIDYTTNDIENNLRIGQRVCIPSLSMYGTVRFFGETKFTNGGNWVGIELDIKGTGKNDGSIQGVRYFSCPPDSGIFILSNKVVPEKPITPRVSRTTAHKTVTPLPRKSMITRKAPTTILPSKSARIISNNSHQPLPTRSSPSINKKTSSATTLSKPTNAKLKKSSSLSTASSTESSCHHRHHHGAPEKKKIMRGSSSSKTTRNEVDELKRVSALLEKSRQEQKALSEQIDGKEAAWERLLSAKESYALRVQEKDDELNRLKREFEQSRLSHDQLIKLTSEKDAALSRASMSEAMEKQHIKVIERLELRLRTLQDENSNLISNHEYKLRDNAAQIDQLRKQLTLRDEATAATERECSELRQLNRENSRVYEASFIQSKQEHDNALAIKDAQIQRLQYIINDFSNCLPSSPLTPMIDDTRRRLEVQLELSTQELDRERELRKSMSDEIDQLKIEIKRLHRASVSSSSQFYSIREELENEIKDKVRIMEEANAALETQSRIEEENERIRITHDKTQRDLSDLLKKLALMEKQQQQQKTGLDEDALLERNRQLELENERILESQRQTEHECMRLMDELLAIEKANQSQEDLQCDERMYKIEIEQLKLQVIRETKKYQDLENAKQVKFEQLNKELSDLESLVENKVFNQTELEETLENEKRKVRLLESKLKEEEEKNYHHKRSLLNNQPPMSPTSPQYSSIFHMNKKRSSSATASSFTLMTSSSLDTVSDHGSNLLESVYCEICEEYGHDVMTCTAFVQIDEYEHDTLPSSSYYCVNCDVFGTHPTEECPNQDETF